ncbi:LacI family DNA-binding transcriptional regulator [Cohnella candidum]|uniref:LacI family transcriptional regulator n=1 Tax=Cohnella candidum TaxID=2674991 RepID=A0A3G3K068_9BACL|nr:LacI family DNA-binding transcriptional regulator [Cohnella candidum]AYQ73896.1 LacI family transcriptional regulator [Cohnella candidum]
MVTIKDIAKKAGVSITTVSRALNGYDDVNETTRRKVTELAQQMGYSPNMAARSLIMKKTKTLGLLLSGITRNSAKDNIAFEVLCGMNDRAGELNYDLVLFSTTPQKQKVKSYKALCHERGVDGVIIMGIRLDDPYLNEIITSDIACVLIDIPLKGPQVGFATSDNVGGAYRATRHLLENGHRNIGFINGHSQAHVSIQRLDGFKQALAEAGLSLDDSLLLDGSFSEEGGKEAAYQLLSKRPDVTAIFCASDLMALGAMQAVRGLGLRIPEDISIIGFDNINVTEYSTPALTTVHQNKYELGYHSAQMLIDLLEGRNVQTQLTLPTELVRRGSVADIRK